MYFLGIPVIISGGGVPAACLYWVSSTAEILNSAQEENPDNAQEENPVTGSESDMAAAKDSLNDTF